MKVVNGIETSRKVDGLDINGAEVVSDGLDVKYDMKSDPLYTVQLKYKEKKTDECCHLPMKLEIYHQDSCKANSNLNSDDDINKGKIRNVIDNPPGNLTPNMGQKEKGDKLELATLSLNSDAPNPPTRSPGYFLRGRGGEDPS